MIMQETRELIQKAVEIELQNALEQTTFKDAHHAFAVLKEEAEEAFDNLTCVECDLNSFWRNIKQDDVERQKRYLRRVRAKAQDVIYELAQVIAVCEKAEMQVYKDAGAL